MGLGFLAKIYDVSIFSREIWVVFDLLAIVVLGISYYNDEDFQWAIYPVIFLILLNLFGPLLYTGHFLPLVEYWPYSNINLIVGGLILFTGMG